MENALIPLPPLEEQQRIVDILNRAAKIATLRTRAADRLRELPPALSSIYSARIDGMADDVMAPLENVADIIAGQSPPGSTYNETGSGLPFFQGSADFGAIFPVARKWCTAPKKIAEVGDILISVRAPVGPTNIAKERCCIGRGLAAIRADETIVLRDFLHWIIKYREPELVSGGRDGATFKAIRKQDLDALPIPLFPLDEQRRISDILNRIAQIDTMRGRATERHEALTDCLLHRLF